MLRRFGYSFEYGNDNVPILSNRMMSDITNTMLADYDDQLLSVPQPLNVDDFVEFYLQYEIEEVHLSHNLCYLGRFVFHDEEKIPIYLPHKNQLSLLVNRSNTVLLEAKLSEDLKYQALRRFTMMHEVGHAVLHQRYFGFGKGQMELFGVEDHNQPMSNEQAYSYAENIRDYTEGGSRPLITPNDWLEYQANTFVSHILMNEKSLREILNFYHYSPSSSQILKEYIIAQMSSTYGVSSSAARVRLSVHDRFFSESESIGLF